MGGLHRSDHSPRPRSRSRWVRVNTRGSRSRRVGGACLGRSSGCSLNHHLGAAVGCWCSGGVELARDLGEAPAGGARGADPVCDFRWERGGAAGWRRRGCFRAGCRLSASSRCSSSTGISRAPQGISSVSTTDKVERLIPSAAAAWVRSKICGFLLHAPSPSISLLCRTFPCRWTTEQLEFPPTSLHDRVAYGLQVLLSL